jgi:hypothetical protein
MDDQLSEIIDGGWALSSDIRGWAQSIGRSEERKGADRVVPLSSFAAAFPEHTRYLAFASSFEQGLRDLARQFDRLTVMTGLLEHLTGWVK